MRLLTLISPHTQIFVDGLFNADPHPGNILIDRHSLRPVLLDFGLTKEVRFAAPAHRGARTPAFAQAHQHRATFGHLDPPAAAARLCEAAHSSGRQRHHGPAERASRNGARGADFDDTPGADFDDIWP